MISDNKHTIFDNVKAFKIKSGYIPELDIESKPFSIIKENKIDDTLIIKENKAPAFNFKLDNELNDFFDFPDLSLSSNPEYRYKYPKLTTEEFSRQMRQTEQGTPNELNQFLRQDQTGDKIEDIKANDNEYEKGLQEVQKLIDEDTNTLIKGIDDRTNEPLRKRDKKNLKHNIKENIEIKHTVKNYNPVKINPAIPINELTKKTRRELDLLYDIKDKTSRSVEKNVKKLLKPDIKRRPYVNIDTPKIQLNEAIEQARNKKLKSISEAPQPPLPPTKPKKMKNIPPLPPDDEELTKIYKEKLAKFENELQSGKAKLKSSKQKGVEESKTTEPNTNKPKNKTSKITISNPEEEKKLTKIQLLLKQKNAKKVLEEKRKSIDPSDDKTVIETLNTPAESYKTNANAFKKLIEIYDFVPKNSTIDILTPEDQVKMKGLMKALGISGKTKKIEKLREKAKNF